MLWLPPVVSVLIVVLPPRDAVPWTPWLGLPARGRLATRRRDLNGFSACSGPGPVIDTAT